jgi:23S rRNA (adenine2503-C2)-methyltransferase
MSNSSEIPLITDLSLIQLEEKLLSMGEPKFRSKQIWEGIYHSLVSDFRSISNLSKSLRQKLDEQFYFNSLTPHVEVHSNDKQTTKILFETRDNRKIETVLMKYNERNTLCISTQSGCAMGCVFCATGQMGFFRSLSAGEIVEQVLYFSRQLRLKNEKVTNIVFMGMGEPFHNYDATLKAVDLLGDFDGYNMGARRLTISTVGIIPQIMRFADEKRQVNLAVSLHSIDDEARSNMMPVNKKYPVNDLLKACAYYMAQTNRRISFEWALIDGANDSVATARRLANKLRSLLCHVNLIQLNPTNKYSGKGSSKETAEKFKDTLEQEGIPCTIRLRRGIDIHAGCGQLATSTD